MKTLTGLDDKLEAVLDEMNPDVIAQMPTFRRVYRVALGNMMASSPNEAMDAVTVGLLLRGPEGTVVLEDAEFKLLRRAVEANAAQLVAHLYGQALLRLTLDERLIVGPGETKP